MATNKGFITDFGGNKLLPITRGELVLDKDGNVALTSQYFEAGKDNNNYGLISAGELNAIRNSLGLGSSGPQGNSLTDVYNKLSHINSGLKVNGTSLNFYNADGTKIETNIQSFDQNAILIGLANNVLSIGLKEFSEIDKTATNQIIKGIKVDKYGRVTEVTQSQLNNNEIPPTLTGKLLSESTASDIPIGSTNGALIANKNYVDSQIGEIKGIATGALRFEGSIDQDIFNSVNSNLNLKEGYYYKVTSEFNISNTLLGMQGSSQTTRVKVGDTLIIHNGHFIHIPSGDDITSISIQKVNNNVASNVLSAAIGSILFKFTNAFNVTSNETNKVDIDIQTAEIINGTYQKGVLSETDYKAFKALETSSSNVIYTSVLDSGEHLGTLTINGTDHKLYYRNHQYNVQVNQNNNSDVNPILNLIDQYNNKSNDIIFKSTHKGISVKKSDNNIEFTSNYIIDTDSDNYLEFVDSYKLKAKIGSFNPNSTVNVEGLVSTSTLQNYIYNYATHFEIITGSLTSTNPDSTYQYNNDALKNAINVNI